MTPIAPATKTLAAPGAKGGGSASQLATPPHLLLRPLPWSAVKACVSCAGIRRACRGTHALQASVHAQCELLPQ